MNYEDIRLPSDEDRLDIALEIMIGEVERESND